MAHEEPGSRADDGGHLEGPRASDADRERFAAQLHEHYAEGRLSIDELQRRLDVVFAAQTLVQLYETTSDLPHPGVPLSNRYEPPRSTSRRPGWWPFR